MSKLQNSPQNAAENGYISAFAKPFKAINRIGKLESYYTQAENIFKDRPYAERYRPLYELAAVYPKIYHVLSVLLALATDYLIADVLSDTSLQDQMLRSFSTLFIAGIFALLLLFVFIGIEYLKRMFSCSVFLAKSINEDIKSIDIVSLIALMALSIGLSGVGGAFLTYTLADRTDALKIEMHASLDSVNTSYTQKIAEAKNAKDAYFEANNYKGVITYTKDGVIAKQYQTLTERVLELEKEQPNAVKDIRSEYRAEILSSNDNAFITGAIAALIILFLELVTLLGYNYQYKYHASVKDEGVKLRVIHTSSHDQNIFNTLAHARTPLPLSTLGVHDNAEDEEEKKNLIGFKIGERAKPKIGDNEGGYHIICLECGTHAVKKVKTAKFCSSKCRFAYNRKKVRASSQG